MFSFTYKNNTIKVKSFFDKTSAGWYRKGKDGLGFKIFDTGFNSTFRTIKELKKSVLLKKVKKEFKIQKKVYESLKCTSKPISIEFILCSDGKYRIVFVMEHLRGYTLNMYGKEIKYRLDTTKGKLIKTLSHNRMLENDIYHYLNQKLSKIKISHRDYHGNNIIITPKKEIKVIDFGWATIES